MFAVIFGFGSLEILILLFVAVAGGGIAYYVWVASKNRKPRGPEDEE